MDAPLKLRAKDDADIAVIAACLQDALVPLGDLTYLPEDRQFVAVLNRFCWEAAEDARAAANAYQRVLCGLRFDGVRGVKLRGVDRRDTGRLLQLLTIESSDDAITLVFAGGVAFRLEVEAVRCSLEDLVEPWPTQWQPSHDGEAGEAPPDAS